MADRTRKSRQGRQIQREVRSGRVWISRFRHRLTIIPTPLGSRPSVSTESRGTGLVLASSCLEVLKPIRVDSRGPSADNSIDSQDGEYEDYNGQSEKTEVYEVEEEEEEEEEELGHREDENLSLDWGAQGSIRYGFREPQPSILTLTPGYTQSSGRGIDYP